MQIDANYSNAEHDATQFGAIRDLMLEASTRGDWLTLAEIAASTEFGEASISAQLRHLRKPRFGHYRVEKRRRDLCTNGVLSFSGADCADTSDDLEPVGQRGASGDNELQRVFGPWEYRVFTAHAIKSLETFEADDAIGGLVEPVPPDGVSELYSAATSDFAACVADAASPLAEAGAANANPYSCIPIDTGEGIHAPAYVRTPRTRRTLRLGRCAIGKLPSMQFYIGDWLKDPAVRACSLAARGLWTDLLCLMWESPERGVLKTGEQPWGAQEMASAVGADVTLVAKLLAELKSKGVTSARAEDGALYSRRTVRDEVERRKDTDRQQRYRASGQQSAAQSTRQSASQSASQSNGANYSVASSDDDVTPLSHDSSSSVSSSVSSSTTNLSLNFTGERDLTREPDQSFDRSRAQLNNSSDNLSNGQSNGRARRGESHAREPAESVRPNTRLEELRLQAEILGRQERLRGKWPVANASATVGMGPQPGMCGVRAKASAIERARAREEKAS